MRQDHIVQCVVLSMRKLVLFGLFLSICAAVYTMTAQRAVACSCAAPSEEMATETYEAMDYVFEAEVLRISPVMQQRPPTAIVKITRLYKGELPSKELGFAYNSHLSACGLNLKAGQLITVGAYDFPNSQPRLTHSCAQMAIRKYLIMQGGYPR